MGFWPWSENPPSYEGNTLMLSTFYFFGFELFFGAAFFFPFAAAAGLGFFSFSLLKTLLKRASCFPFARAFSFEIKLFSEVTSFLREVTCFSSLLELASWLFRKFVRSFETLSTFSRRIRSAALRPLVFGFPLLAAAAWLSAPISWPELPVSLSGPSILSFSCSPDVSSSMSDSCSLLMSLSETIRCSLQREILLAK